MKCINFCFQVMRKPVRKTSLFKFMTVLRLEVWLSIVGALTLTGIMIWILDKYSPYSARNNKRLYPYPCRYAHFAFISIIALSLFALQLILIIIIISQILTIISCVHQFAHLLLYRYTSNLTFNFLIPLIYYSQ